ncbi:hypothetical protein ANN_23812 [Periplaneta americana]|uniref:Tc1-like transposase DDE domain-containing protein n=1 Tax=Periplaneta americana TaxID=6978 RepID=A0ABQ8SM50_PERAM|nr:hypothetical protein ANN_23812 [Periplaneta americana]
MIEWMDAKGIGYRTDMVKDELIEQIKIANVNKKFDKYVVDSMAEQAGHTVFRLPPYHRVLNPIEAVSSKVKGYVALNNKSFKLKLNEVRTLLNEGLKLVTPHMWRSFIRHVEGEEEKFWKSDGLCDTIVDRFVINPTECSSSGGEDEKGSFLKKSAPCLSLIR